MLRLGFKELRNAFNPSRESIADTELGLYGSATQREIGNQMGVNDSKENAGKETMSDLRAAAQEKAKENEQGKDGPAKNGPEQDRGQER
jgi:hypothetical protein